MKRTGFIEDVSVTLADSTFPTRARIIVDKHSKLWLSMMLTLKKVYSVLDNI